MPLPSHKDLWKPRRAILTSSLGMQWKAAGDWDLQMELPGHRSLLSQNLQDMEKKKEYGPSGFV